MSNSKISALTSVTTPLAGTEVLPVVQSSTTKQVSVANLTAGRAVSAASLALTTPLPASSGGTGLSALGTGVATWLGTPSSANLAAAVTDETGSGSLVFGTSPTMITPTIGPSGNFTDSYLTITQSGFSTGGQSYQVFKDANGVTGAINSWGSAYGGTYSLGIALSSNMVNNSSLGGTLQYGQTGVSTMYKQYNGGHYFYRAASGTGGTNISYQEVLTTDTNNNITFTAGNLVQGTAAKGVNFTANTPLAGMTSQLLNWYEEGTWTPNQGAGLTVIGAFSSSGVYTRIGRQVTVKGQLNGATSIAIPAAVGQLCTNLPFTASTAYTGTAINNSLAASCPVTISAAIVYSSGTLAASAAIFFSATYTV